MLKNYIKIAIRNILKGKIYSFINIFGLSVAIAACLLIGLYIAQELSFDRFHNDTDRIYRVVNTLHGNTEDWESASTPPPLAPLLSENLREVDLAVRIHKDIGAVRVENRIFEQELLTVDDSFFKLFNFRLINGDSETVLKQPNHVVITRFAAERFFGSTDVIGKSIEIGIRQKYHTFTITGVADNPPVNSSIRFEVLIPAEFRKRTDPGQWDRPNWGTLSPFTFVKLRDGANPARIPGSIDDLVKAHLPDSGDRRTHLLQSMKEIHFDTETRAKIGPVTNLDFIYMLAGISIIVLVIACINFTILTVGYSTRRAREVGMRKTLGALQSQIRIQFWGETVITALISLIAGLFLAELLLPVFNRMVETPLIGITGSPGLLWIIVIIITVTALLAGSYPAAYLARFKPVDVLKGKPGIGGNQPLIRALTVFQFSLSLFLIIGTLFMSRQMNYMLGKDLGYNQEQVIMINGPATPEGANVVERLRSILQTNPEILAVSGSWNRMGSAEGVGFQGLPVISEATEIRAASFGIDYQLIELLGIELLEGRFPDEYLVQRNEVLVNKEFVDRMGWDSALGKSVSKMFDFENAEIIGVVENFHFESFHSAIEPLVMFSIPFISTIYVRTETGNLRETLADIEHAWETAAPDLPFVYRFMDEEIQQQYEYENRWTLVMNIGSIITVLIACMGLFGLATLASVKRKKEISIRKVYGAGVGNLVQMLTTDYLKPVLLGFVIAIPFAWLAINHWLEQFVFRIEPDWWIFAIAGIISIIIALVTVCFQVVKTALMNPVESLRTE